MFPLIFSMCSSAWSSSQSIGLCCLIDLFCVHMQRIRGAQQGIWDDFSTSFSTSFEIPLLLSHIHQTARHHRPLWQCSVSQFHRPYRRLKLCSEDFSLLSRVTTKIFYTWLVRIQTMLSVWQMFGLLIYSSTVCGLLPSTWLVWSLSGSLVRWWTCHSVSDLPICYFSNGKGKEAFRQSPPRSPHFGSPQMWCQDNRGRGVYLA